MSKGEEGGQLHRNHVSKSAGAEHENCAPSQTNPPLKGHASQS